MNPLAKLDGRPRTGAALVEGEAGADGPNGSLAPKGGFSAWRGEDQDLTRAARGGRARARAIEPESPRTLAVQGLTSAFLRKKVAGPQALERIQAAFVDRPVVLVAGHQLTGKSTVATRLAELLGGQMKSLGAAFRAEAARRQIEIAELAKLIAKEPDLERYIDFQSALSIAAAEAPAFEGRLAGAFGALMSSLGRSGVFTVYLDCAPKERARRYLERDLKLDVSTPIIAAALSKTPDDADLATCLAILARSGSPELAQAAETMANAATRDDRDMSRYRALYNIDYQAPQLYDLVVDTTRLDRDAVFAAIVGALPDGFTRQRV